tara:strand:+ start:389 stop:778 length:390 start_codon:yes stop_codon:yes gene_type:complete
MEIFLIIIQRALENKEIKRFLLLSVVVIFAFIIGILSASDPEVDKEKICKKHISNLSICEESSDLLQEQVEMLEKELIDIQQKRYTRESEVVEEQKVLCDKNTSKKIKDIKKTYLDAKCKICVKSGRCK